MNDSDNNKINDNIDDRMKNHRSWKAFKREQEQLENSADIVADDTSQTEPVTDMPIIEDESTAVTATKQPTSGKREIAEDTGAERENRKTKTVLSPEEKNKKTLRICAIILIVAVAGSCVGLYLKFSADRAFVEQELSRMEQSNQESFADLSTRLNNIEEQMNSISAALAEVDESFSSNSSASREAMSKRIEELDKQLNSLKQALELLKESKGNI